MNKKILLCLSLLTLSSCSFSIFTSSLTTSSESLITSNSINDTTNSSSNSEILGDGYYIPSQVEGTLRDNNESFGWNTSKSTGNQKLYIVPVQLKDGPVWTDEMLNNLNLAFFGKTDECKYESVSSYFYKSSYGNLNLTGEISPVYTSLMTTRTVDSYGDYASDNLIKEYVSRVDSNQYKDYDLDKDGYVDNMIFIYSNAYKNNDNTGFWAWCSYASYKPNVSKPTINNYMWASYTFCSEGYVDGYRDEFVDAHTYIHETGHLLGLDDYYSYEQYNGWDCAGTLEMQSYNVGDHNIYSKMALGWVKPMVVTGETTITLRTSSTYPDAILIKDNWNNSLFDEYLLIEYYTPTGLNKVDSEHIYSGRDLMYDESGLRIYHIDARLVEVDSRGNYIRYATSERKDNYFYVIGASNSPSLSFLPSSLNKIYRYVHLLDQGETNKINNGNGGYLTDNVLWNGQKEFIPDSTFFINNDSFNDGQKINYKISVSNLTSENCQVSITHL